MEPENTGLPYVVIARKAGGDARRRAAAEVIAAELLRRLAVEEKSLQNRLQSEKNCGTISS